jgi:hypothetical protein
MVFCTKCGHEIENPAAPCPNCGTSAGEPGLAQEPEEAQPPRKQAPGRVGLIVLGALLLIGFFMPVYTGTDLVVPSFEMFRAEGVSGVAKFRTLYTLIAGVAVIAAAFALKGLVRHLAVIALGLVPLIVFYVSLAAHASFAVGGTLVMGGALALVAMALILAGSRARYYRPSSSLGALTGAAGGVAYIVAMVLPILPRELGRIAIVAPIMQIIGKTGGPEPVVRIIAGCLDLLAKVLLLTASIVCLVNVAPRPVVGLRARAASRFWIWSVVVLFLGALVPAGRELYWALDGGTPVDQALLGTALPAVSALAGLGLSSLALFLLVPMGLTALIVHFSKPEAGPLPGYAESAAPAAAQAGPAGLETRLKTLKRMLDEGLISEEDFEKKKEDILSSM